VVNDPAHVRNAPEKVFVTEFPDLMVGDYLTEINVTSPTGIRAVRNVGGPDIAKLVWDKIEGMRRG
jgi:glutathione synthase/RimK-type ligase-like ATP-grasp enzyme